MLSHVFRPAVYDCLLPRPEISTAEWCTDHLLMPNESKLQGLFREPMDAFDDPSIDRITIQTGAQIGKTVFAQACLCKTAACNPHPMAFADSDERSLRRVIRRTWQLFERCDELQDLVPPKRRQSSERIELPTCVIHGAWSGSASSAADYGAYVVVLNECDKMKHRSTDTEADFRWLMGERTKGYIGSKIIQISTPSLKDQSYVESQRLAGDNRRRMVPCPHCGEFQELYTGDGKTPGGLRFNRRPDGSLDVDIARKSAWYECLHCRERIDEHHRFAMCNAGRWVMEGCEIDRSGTITGTPARPGSHASFGPLSTLHSLLPGVTLGLIAQEWAKALTAKENRREAIRNYVNSWDGQTFDPQPQSVTTVDIIHRFGVEEPLKVCPEWVRFVTLAADVGRDGDELFFYWGACGWGELSRGQLIDYGLTYGRDALRQLVQSISWPHSDDGPPITPAQVGIDSGDGISSGAIYDLCRSLPHCWPLKGSSSDEENPFNSTGSKTSLEFYKGGFKAEHSAHIAKTKRRLHDYDLLIVNTSRTQQWVEDRLSGLVKPAEPEWFSIPMAALRGRPVADIDLIRHLQGDYQDSQGRWKKRYRDQDLRDMIRYNRVLAEKYTDNGAQWDRLAPRIVVRSPSAHESERSDRSGFLDAGDGFTW